MSLALRTRTPAAALLLAPTCEARWGALRREAVKTPSPNSGWPMAAMALALDIHLAKPGVSMLNPDGGVPLHTHTHSKPYFLHQKRFLPLCLLH